MTPQSQNFRLSKSKICSSNLFFHNSCVHPYKDFFCLSLERQPEISKILILTPRCAVWLRNVMHTTEFDSAVWCTLQKLDSAVECTPRSLTLQYDAHSGAWLHDVMHTAEFFWEIWVTWLRGGMHTAESDSKVCITPRSQTSLKMSVFEFSNS